MTSFVMMRGAPQLIGGVAACAILLATEPANAITIPPLGIGDVSVAAYVGNNYTSVSDPTHNQAAPPLAATLPGASASILSGPTVNMQASVTFGGIAADAVFVYMFTVTGGTPGSTVKVDVETSLSATDDNSGRPNPAFTPYQATAQISVHPTDPNDYSLIPVDNFANQSACSALSQHCPGGFVASPFNGILQVNALVGHLETIYLDLEVQGNRAYSGSAEAFADPYIYIDLSNSDPGQYSVLVSSNVGNSPLGATPLPAALPLFASGLGALGLFGWRRKRKNTAPMATA
jgi:hypothetical protein